MVTGTNGADFEHREKIAAQYQIRWDKNVIKEVNTPLKLFILSSIHV